MYKKGLLATVVSGSLVFGLNHQLVHAEDNGVELFDSSENVVDASMVVMPLNKKSTDYILDDVIVYVNIDELAKGSGVSYHYDVNESGKQHVEMMRSSAIQAGHKESTSPADVEMKKKVMSAKDVSKKVMRTIQSIEIGSKVYMHDFVTLHGYSGSKTTIVSVLYDVEHDKPVKLKGKYILAKDTVDVTDDIMYVDMPFQYVNVDDVTPLVSSVRGDKVAFDGIRDTKQYPIFTEGSKSGTWVFMRTIIVNGVVVSELKDTTSFEHSESNHVTVLKDGYTADDVDFTVFKPVATSNANRNRSCRLKKRK